MGIPGVVSIFALFNHISFSFCSRALRQMYCEERQFRTFVNDHSSITSLGVKLSLSLSKTVSLSKKLSLNERFTVRLGLTVLLGLTVRLGVKRPYTLCRLHTNRVSLCLSSSLEQRVERDDNTLTIRLKQR